MGFGFVVFFCFQGVVFALSVGFAVVGLRFVRGVVLRCCWVGLVWFAGCGCLTLIFLVVCLVEKLHDLGLERLERWGLLGGLCICIGLALVGIGFSDFLGR